MRQLLAGTGARLLVGEVTGIDLERRELLVVTGERTKTVGYDILLYALGTMIDVSSVPGVSANAHTLAGPQAAARLRKHVTRVADVGGTLVVCGGDLTGIEAAAEFAESYPGLHVRLVARDEPGGWLSQAGQAYLHAALARLGVDVVAGAEIVAVEQRALVLAGGGAVGFDACLWAGGFAVPTLAREAELAVNPQDRVLVDDWLRSISHPEVYAAGDAAAAGGRWGESIAYGCRTGGFMAPYVADTIAGALAGRSRRPFGFRYIHQCISLGRGDALIQFVHPRDEHAAVRAHRPARGPV